MRRRDERDFETFVANAKRDHCCLAIQSRYFHGSPVRASLASLPIPDTGSKRPFEKKSCQSIELSRARIAFTIFRIGRSRCPCGTRWVVKYGGTPQPRSTTSQFLRLGYCLTLWSFLVQVNRD